jgi:uncharacterized LabA/DUF88 family protein
MMFAGTRSRIEVYIDLYNIRKYICDKELILDFIEMVNKVSEGRQITVNYVFDAYMQYGFDPSRRMHDWMRNNGFVMRLNPYDPNKQEQKGVDMEMGLKMYSRARDNMYDVALLITGDGDFVPACKYVQALGKKVEVAAFSEILSSELRKNADRYHDLMNVASPMYAAHTNTNMITRSRVNDMKEEEC